jgi:hypothetical protein
MNYTIQYQITYRDGTRRRQTRMVTAKNPQEAWQQLRNWALQSYGTEDITHLATTEMKP